MSESLWRTSLAEYRERFKELGRKCQLDCLAWSPIGDEPPELVARQKVGFLFCQQTGCRIYGTDEGWKSFIGIAGSAFECVKVSPIHVQRMAFDYRLPSFGTGNAAEWLHLVVDLAARRIQGSPLVAVQKTWRDRWVQELDDLPALRKLFDGKKFGEFGSHSMPTGENWFIELKDLANSSVRAVDILLSQTVIDADPAKTQREALHIIDDIIDDVDATKPPALPHIELRPLFERLAALAALRDMPPPVEFIGERVSVSLILRAPNGARKEILVRRDKAQEGMPFYEDRFDEDTRRELFACLRKWRRRLEEPLEAVDLKENERDEPAEQSQAVASLKPCELKAYLLFQHAEDQTERRIKDRKAYDWLNENGWPDDLFPGASDYELPTFSTWSKQTRAGRRAHGTSKRRRRAPSMTTRSVVRQRDLDSPRDD